MAYKICLSSEQKAELKQIIRKNQNKQNVLKRAYCILLKNEGQRNENITQLLKIHQDSITDWIKIYLNCGIDGLLKYKYTDRRKSKLSPYKSRIKRMAAGKRINTIEQLQTKIKENLQIDIEYSWLYRYCKKNEIYNVLKKTKINSPH